MFIAPSIITQADQDKDGTSLAPNFDALGSKWLKEWDTDQSGLLHEAKIRAGLNTSLAGPGPGPGSFRPGGDQGAGARPEGPPDLEDAGQE